MTTFCLAKRRRIGAEASVRPDELSLPLFQYLVSLAIVGIATAYPAADHGQHDASPYIEPKYAPKPKYSPAPYKEKDLPPQPYQFEYGVADQYTGAHFQASETQDAGGNVLGMYASCSFGVFPLLDELLSLSGARQVPTPSISLTAASRR